MFFRSFLALLQPVVIFIIQSVLQNYFIQETKQTLKKIGRRLLLGSHLLALCTNAMCVKKEKIKRLRTCNLQFVGAVRKHTTESACLGASIFVSSISVVEICSSYVLFYALPHCAAT